MAFDLSLDLGKLIRFQEVGVGWEEEGGAGVLRGGRASSRNWGDLAA